MADTDITIFGPEFDDEMPPIGTLSEKPSTSIPVISVVPSLETPDFTGLLTITGDPKRNDEQWVRFTSGGIVVEVLLADKLPLIEGFPDWELWSIHRFDAVRELDKYDGQRVTLNGTQEEAVIVGAKFLRTETTPAAVAIGTRGTPLALGATVANSEWERIALLSRRALPNLIKAVPVVVFLRVGYKWVSGVQTDTLALIVEVHPSALTVNTSSVTLEQQVRLALGTEAEGIVLDIAPASPARQMAIVSTPTGVTPVGAESSLLFGPQPALEAGTVEAFRLPSIGYTPPQGTALTRVTDAMRVTLHASPDAGFTQLRRFLEGTSERLTIGMYDFTAPHVLRAIRAAAIGATGDLEIILEPGESLPSGDNPNDVKADDLPESEVRRQLTEALQARFRLTDAVVSGSRRVFASAYHIKVCVRDGRSFWLSSGNWQSSNQPDLDAFDGSVDPKATLKRYNREWHVIVEHEPLARTFETFLRHDMKQARQAQGGPEATPSLPDIFVPLTAFAPLSEREAGSTEAEAVPRFFAPLRLTFTAAQPLTVQPLLTPDNFAEQVLPVIAGAQRQILFQNQGLKPLAENGDAFDRLLTTLRDKQCSLGDVRIILRDFNARESLDALKLMGFETDGDHIRIQKGCHTKGIVVDGKTVIIGSHNWTNHGTQFNRDASLIFWESRIARYYADLFEHDWRTLARPLRIDIPASEAAQMPLIAPPGVVTPDGYLRIPWRAYYEDGEL